MNIVLLSGGSGKRLWPLSNDTMSKQFLKVLKNGDGQYQSMVQRVYDQIRGAGLDCGITVATSTAQVDSIKNQLGDRVTVVLEPERRNTFPAIALSCAHLREQGMSRDDVVVVLPVDPYAEQAYFETLRVIERAVLDRAGAIVLMGVSPTYPSEKYGYIIPAAGGRDGWKPVSHFKEKPDETDAARLISDGALWNCGVFAFKLGYMLDLIETKLPEATTYAELEAQYHELPAGSFDYEVLEKADSVAVVKYSGLWKDLGTWNTLTEEMDGPVLGKNILLDETCSNTHVINVLDIPVVVMGARDTVVVASHDGVLVADKHQSSYIKPLADRVSRRPMYEARRWGNYRVIDCAMAEDQVKNLTRRINILAGQALSYHRHAGQSDTWIVTAGQGELLLDGNKIALRQGDTVHIPAGAKHAVRALTDLEIIEVQIGDSLSYEDKECFEMEW